MSEPSRPPRLFSREQSPTLPQLRLNAVKARPIQDLYYYLMRSAGWMLLLLFAVVFLGLNALFGLVYMEVGGIAQARPGNFSDAFFFSVQTFGTIGYGGMAPQSLAAHWVVTLESMVGLLSVAMVTGLTFARFSRPRARVVFSDVALIALRNGQPTLMYRVGNERANHVVEATLRMTLIRTVRTQEGEQLRQMDDLELVRAQSPAFIITWTALHVINEKSPLHGATPKSLRDEHAEILITLTGYDGVLAQTLHARHSYVPEELRWGHRFLDLFSFGKAGVRQVDYAKFHETELVPEDPLSRLLGEEAPRGSASA